MPFSLIHHASLMNLCSCLRFLFKSSSRLSLDLLLCWIFILSTLSESSFKSSSCRIFIMPFSDLPFLSGFFPHSLSLSLFRERKMQMKNQKNCECVIYMFTSSTDVLLAYMHVHMQHDGALQC
jgi:hypothetical protein